MIFKPAMCIIFSLSILETQRTRAICLSTVTASTLSARRLTNTFLMEKRVLMMKMLVEWFKNPRLLLFMLLMGADSAKVNSDQCNRVVSLREVQNNSTALLQIIVKNNSSENFPGDLLRRSLRVAPAAVQGDMGRAGPAVGRLVL